MHYSQREAAKVLGCSAATVAAYEAGQKIPKYVALACGALSYGLPPMGNQ